MISSGFWVGWNRPLSRQIGAERIPLSYSELKVPLPPFTATSAISIAFERTQRFELRGTGFVLTHWISRIDLKPA